MAKKNDICGQLSDFTCKLFCCDSCTFCCWAATKERLKSHCKTNKKVKGVSYVDKLSSVQLVTNVHSCVHNLLVGASLRQFWKTWTALGASSKAIRTLWIGHTHTFLGSKTQQQWRPILDLSSLNKYLISQPSKSKCQRT